MSLQNHCVTNCQRHSLEDSASWELRMNLGMLIGYLFVGTAVGLFAAFARRREPLMALATLAFWVALGPVVLAIIMASWLFSIALLSMADASAAPLKPKTATAT